MNHVTVFNVVALTLVLAVSGLLGVHALWVAPLVCVAVVWPLVEPAEPEHHVGEELDSLAN